MRWSKSEYPGLVWGHLSTDGYLKKLSKYTSEMLAKRDAELAASVAKTKAETAEKLAKKKVKKPRKPRKNSPWHATGALRKAV